MERSEGSSRVLRLRGCCIAIPNTTRVLCMWGMVHILHAANDERFGEPLPSGWEHCSFLY